MGHLWCVHHLKTRLVANRVFSAPIAPLRDQPDLVDHEQLFFLLLLGRELA
jgi:hypothetical protein